MKRTNDLGSEITQLLGKQKNRPMLTREIAAALGVRGKQAKMMHETMNRLLSAGEIVRARKDRYMLGAPADLVTGILDVLRSGNGFVIPAEGKAADVFVGSRDMDVALPGDKVVVRISPDRDRSGVERRAGKIIRILERKRHDIVGTLKATAKFLYVVPLDATYDHDFYVPEKKGANIGDRVVIRFTGWANRHVNPEAEVIEVIGPEDDPSLDTIAIVKHAGFRTTFPLEVIKEAESVSELMKKPGKRIDLRKEFILTIDPERARDFDDALSLGKDEQGNDVLGVHIADVCHFVQAGSLLDEEAYERGNSVYLPDLVIPMLPEQLSNGVCSLKPDEDRFAFTVFITMDAEGKVIRRKFAKSIIRSKLRLSYRQALSLLEGKRLDVANASQAGELLSHLHNMAQGLRRKRFARFALDLDMPDCEIVLDSSSMMTGIRLEENDISHQLIEECMIAANEAVAQELADRGVPLISRFHDKPQPEKVEELQMQLIRMGYKPGDLSKPRNLSKFLDSTKNDPLAHSIRVAVLRSMPRALYTADMRGHFGLSKAHYAHFTSPIRRYPDLILHRQLDDLVARGKKTTYSKERLSAIAMNSSETEKNAADAERTVIEIKKYRFLEQQLKSGKPDVYDAVVVLVSNVGLFVEVLDLQIQGLVHISSISSKFVRFNANSRTLKAANKTYKLGDRLKVSVVTVDTDKRRLDFRIV